MKKTILHIALGIAALSPLCSIGLIVVVVSLRISSATIFIERTILATIVTSMVIYVLALTYFLWAVAQEKRLDSSAKSRWTLVLLMGFPIGAIAFWYRYVWTSENRPLSPRSDLGSEHIE